MVKRGWFDWYMLLMFALSVLMVPYNFHTSVWLTVAWSFNAGLVVGTYLIVTIAERFFIFRPANQ